MTTRQRRLLGLVTGLTLGLAYALTANLINPLVLNDIPFYYPWPGLLPLILASTLLSSPAFSAPPIDSEPVGTVLANSDTLESVEAIPADIDLWQRMHEAIAKALGITVEQYEIDLPEVLRIVPHIDTGRILPFAQAVAHDRHRHRFEVQHVDARGQQPGQQTAPEQTRHVG